MVDETTSRFVNAAEMGDRLGVRSCSIRRWARQGLIPALVLPNGRLVFDPDAVVAALRRRGAMSSEEARASTHKRKPT